MPEVGEECGHKEIGVDENELHKLCIRNNQPTITVRSAGVILFLRRPSANLHFIPLDQITRW